jgi:hypothetical protein
MDLIFLEHLGVLDISTTGGSSYLLDQLMRCSLGLLINLRIDSVKFYTKRSFIE